MNTTSTKPVFDLQSTYLHLDEGTGARTLPVGPDFWATIDSRTDLDRGRLVGVFPYTEDWDHAEMHPAGDEVVFLLSGSVDLVLDVDGGEHVVELRGRTGCLVPRGVWHRAIVHTESEVLHITPGEGTQHRPA